jgi:mRNA-degrading endonuclease RelE of RelBE toxin-antitoxin system
MKWTVNFTRTAGKQTKNLSKSAFEALRLLIKDLETNGPAPGVGWSNYGKLRGNKGDLRHCHLIKGNPTYVCCWEVIDKKIRIIEVYYAGTHEKAPY